MCTFVTAVLPAEARLDRLPPRVRIAGIGLANQPLDNRHVRRQLAAGDRYVCATRSYCDCGTVLGSAVPGRAADEEAAAWLGYLRAVLAEAAPRIGLLLHQYSGGLESERIVLKRKERRRIATVNAECLRTMEPDVLYEFTR